MLTFSDKAIVFAIGMIAGVAMYIGWKSAEIDEKLNTIIEQNSKQLIYTTAKFAKITDSI